MDDDLRRDPYRRAIGDSWSGPGHLAPYPGKPAPEQGEAEDRVEDKAAR